jgi:hypothetical protein
MQLRTARLCLDCEEVHESQQCPVCASESFAFLSKWVPVPDRRAAPRPASLDHAAAYRRLLTADARKPKAMRLLKQGAIGLAAVSLARYMWRRAQESTPRDASAKWRPFLSGRHRWLTRGAGADPESRTALSSFRSRNRRSGALHSHASAARKESAASGARPTSSSGWPRSAISRY